VYISPDKIVLVVYISSNISGILAEPWRVNHRLVGFETDGDRRIGLKHSDGPVYFYPGQNQNGTPVSVDWEDITGTPTTLSGYDITDAASSSHTHPWSAITSTPDTLVEYNISDAYTKTEVNTLSGYLQDEIDNIPSGVSLLDDLLDVNTSGEAKNLVLKYNGSQWVPAVYSASFTFSIATFTSNIGATPILISTGQWKAIGSISFSATYNNGPATNGYVSHSGWSNLTMSGVGYVGPTLNTQTVDYPAVGGYQQFTLNATDGTDNSTSSLTYYFYNLRFWGVSIDTTYDESDVEGLASNELSNARAKTFTVTAATGEYIVYAYPSRLGTATFTVGGFGGGFEDPQTVSITNTNGYTENYYVYRSTQSGLGATTVVVS